MSTRNHSGEKNFKNFPTLLKNLQGLHFLPLGGCEEIGMNCNLYFCQGQWLMVDNGVTFSRSPDGVIMTNIIPFIENIDPKSFKGLVITHAHEDHLGAVAHLWRYLRCPIYITPFAAFILRKKMNEARIRLEEVELHEVPLESRAQVGIFDIEFISLTHSIPEPNAIFIRTPEGNIFHTGDWKIDPNPVIGKKIEEEKLKAIGQEGVLALVCDSTNVFEEGISGSEMEVQDALKKIVSECKGRVLISCFSSNQARLASCYEAAKHSGRQLCTIGYSLKTMLEASRYCGYLDIPVITPAQAQSLPPEKVLIVTTGSQAEPRAALTRMSNSTHPDIQLNEGDTVIFSSRVIPGNEEGISDLHNRLIMKKVKLITYRDKIHVSGHPCRDELRQMYAWIKPVISVPVHGQQRHLHEHARFAKELGVMYAAPPINGSVYLLSNQGIKEIGQVPRGRLFLDGARLLDDEGVVRKERQAVFEAGVFTISLIAEQSSKKILNHQIWGYGIFERVGRGPIPQKNQKTRLSWEFKKEKSLQDYVDSAIQHQARLFNGNVEEEQEEKSHNKGGSSSSLKTDASSSKKTHKEDFEARLLRATCATLQEDVLRLFKRHLGIVPVVQVNVIWI